MSHVGMSYTNRTRFPTFSLEFVYSGQNYVVFLGKFWSELGGFPGTSWHLNVGLFVCNIIHIFYIISRILYAFGKLPNVACTI